MAQLNFPKSPTSGDSFVASNGLVYQYDGSKWITLGTEAEQGPKGDKGDPGAKGDPGEKGDKGDPGVSPTGPYVLLDWSSYTLLP